MRKLEWKDFLDYTGPEHLKWRVVCRVSVAFVFDQRTKMDKPIYSYRIGRLTADGFQPMSHLPDDRIVEILDLIRHASSDTHVRFANGKKKLKGTATQSMGGTLLNALLSTKKEDA
jgi:hypothetical protein